MDGITVFTKPARPAGAWNALLAGLCLALGLLAGCRSSAPRPVSPFATEIEERSRDLEAAFRAGNLLGVADAYADDAVLLNGRGERTAGREAIDAYWSAIESPVEWKLKIRSIRGSDDMAYELGTSYLTTRRDGELSTTVTDFLLLWRRQENGTWRIELDAFWPVAQR